MNAMKPGTWLFAAGVLLGSLCHRGAQPRPAPGPWRRMQKNRPWTSLTSMC